MVDGSCKGNPRHKGQVVEGVTGSFIACEVRRRDSVKGEVSMERNEPRAGGVEKKESEEIASV